MFHFNGIVDDNQTPPLSYWAMKDLRMVATARYTIPEIVVTPTLEHVPDVDDESALDRGHIQPGLFLGIFLQTDLQKMGKGFKQFRHSRGRKVYLWALKAWYRVNEVSRKQKSL